MSNKSISIWRFDDAPAILRHLSINGGNEDWVVVVSQEWLDKVQGYWSPLTLFDLGGHSDVDYDDHWGFVQKHIHPINADLLVFITSHA